MNSESLLRKKCLPCEKNVPPLAHEKIEAYLKALSGWTNIQDYQITKMFSFKDFKSALVFVNKVGEIAETEGHHPDIYLAWGKVEITLYTHAIKGLSENDFIMATKIDAIPQ